ncbi:MAG: hypothetical protein ACLFS7_07850 [Desulfosudaceae bacterium]
MKLQDFCNQMEEQVNSYQESLKKIEAELDAGGTKAKQQILPIVGDVKNLISELQAQKDRIEQECPSDWSEEKSKMEDLAGQIGSHVDRAWQELSRGDVGG